MRIKNSNIRRAQGRHNNPKDSFQWGKRVATKIMAKAGSAAAAEFVTMLRRRWKASNSIVDKKAYDGAKLAIPTWPNVNENPKDSGKIEIFNGIVSSSLYKAFGEPFLAKYGLEDMAKQIRVRHSIHDIPCVYFGCYTDADLKQIQNIRFLKNLTFETDIYVH